MDVNRDGVVNEEDAKMLASLFVDVMKKKVEPLLIKAGIEVAESGHLSVLGESQQEKIRTRLTLAEQRELTEAVQYARELQLAAYKAAFQAAQSGKK